MLTSLVIIGILFIITSTIVITKIITVGKEKVGIKGRGRGNSEREREREMKHGDEAEKMESGKSEKERGNVCMYVSIMYGRTFYRQFLKSF